MHVTNTANLQRLSRFLASTFHVAQPYALQNEVEYESNSDDDYNDSLIYLFEENADA